MRTKKSRVHQDHEMVMSLHQDKKSKPYYTYTRTFHPLPWYTQTPECVVNCPEQDRDVRQNEADIKGFISNSAGRTHIKESLRGELFQQRFSRMLGFLL